MDPGFRRGDNRGSEFLEAIRLRRAWGPSPILRAAKVEAAETRPQISKFATFSAFCWMKSRRGSTTSPIRVENTSSASST
jgi:hypothetical protein